MVIKLITRSDGFKQKYNLSPLRPKIKELYHQGLSSRKVGEKLNISHVRVLKILENENIKRRTIIKTITNKNFKKLTKHRAYIFGVMCGDGCIHLGKGRKKNWEYQIYNINLSVKDKDFIDKFVNSIKKTYGIVPLLYYKERNKINPKWSNIWIAKISRKEVYNDLSNYQFGTKNWRVPIEVINSSNDNIISSFLKGYYDSEGSVLIGPRSFSISIHSINYSGLNEVKLLLKKLGINSSKMMTDKRYFNHVFHFAICNKNDIKTFLNKVGFSIKRKYKKIKVYLNEQQHKTLGNSA